MENVVYLEEATKALGAAAYGPDDTSKKQVEAWLSKIKSGQKNATDSKAIDSQLASLTYLVANTLTLADLALFSTQYHVVSSMTAASQHTVPSLVRFISHLSHVATNDARTSQATLAAGYNAFDPTFEGQPQVKRKDPVAEKQQEKQKQAALAAAAAGAGDKTAKKSASEEAAASSSSSGAGATAEGCEKQGKKKEKKAKEGVKSGGGNSGGGEAKKGKNEPAAPTVPLPSMVDLRVGKILDIKKHPDADSLYLETVDFGEAEGPRTVLSGLVNYVSMDKMQDRLVVGICNLKPQAMRGIKSHAMLLCATHKDGKEHGVEPIAPPEASVPGERIYIEGYEGIEPEPVLNPKKKIFEAIQPNYATTASFEAAWFGPLPNELEGEKKLRLIRTAKGICSAPGYAEATLS